MSTVTPTSLPPDNPHRLERAIIPTHYDLRIEPDLAAHGFSGTAGIDLEADGQFDSVTLHAVDLDIASASVTRGNTVSEMTTHHFDETLQRVTLHFDQPVDSGVSHLLIDFSGELNDQLRGFYRSSFEDDDGVEHKIATTQFEATDARRAFPCFDEPSMKATFSITLVVPEGLLAVSNGPEVERTETGDGKVAIRYAETMKMSTYLVAFVIGPFLSSDPVDVDGVPLRVIGRPGTRHLADFALESGVFCLRYLRDYYGIDYPGDKLDLVAIPDFAAGAMENLGCVTFRETALLTDQNTATQSDLLRVLDVIGHELAHMWFGDLVTMEWWDGIWLNEAFATFMEMKATDAMRPDWKRWGSFASAERPWAFEADSLTTARPVEFLVHSPEEANEMFDALTYGKGSAALRMLEQFLGEDTFREGIGQYLRTHSYANTITTDLWSALDSASGIDVGAIMDTWILQPGHPTVTVTAVTVTGERSRLRLTQNRYLARPDPTNETKWQIPLQIRGEVAGAPFAIRHLMSGAEESIDLDGEPDWVIANAGGHGFHRTAYDSASFDRLIDVEPGILDDLERFVIIDDAWAFVQCGDLSVSEYLKLASGYRTETEAFVWQSITSAIGDIRHHVVTDPQLDRFGKVVRTLYEPLMERLGWDPQAGETDLDRRLRGLVIGAMGRMAADQGTIERAEETASAWLADPTKVDPDVGQASLFIMAGIGDIDTFERLMTARKTAITPQIELRILHAVALIDRPAVVDMVIEAMQDGRIRTQDVSWVYGALLGRRDSGRHAWERLRASWDQLTDKMPGFTIPRLVEGLPKLSHPEVVDEIVTFFADRPIPRIASALAQNLERLLANRDLRLRESFEPMD